MFTNTSMTAVGILVYFITFALNYFGITNIDDSQIAQVAESVAYIAGFVLMVWGQLRRKDLQYGMFRIQE